MSLQRRNVAYDGPDGAFEAIFTWDDAVSGPRSGVLVSPTVMGIGGHEIGKAEALASSGYGAFALDIYGVGHRPTDSEEALALMRVLNEDRALLLQRMEAALAAMKRLAEVDESRTAAIGFCFGGKCVLDLARGGAAIDGVASFHGLFDPPPGSSRPINAKILAMHGWDDPLVSPDAVLALAAELTAAGADWQIHAYGGTVHGFTNKARPAMYSAAADQRSWTAVLNFFAELWPSS